jgi:hypothetical protein
LPGLGRVKPEILEIVIRVLALAGLWVLVTVAAVLGPHAGA